ncbi:MAG: carboxypeptidase regulatory-like domain-containing protein, partial [Terriglobales bacterium]
MASALCAFGQEATIVGSVTDPSGASVAGASVTLTDRETGQEHHFVTGGQGEYVAPDIHIGHYTVRVEATGFKAEERKDITLQVGDRARVDFQMQVGTTKETVTVEATAVAVQADTSDISQVVSGDQLEHLGANGRSMYTFLNLTTGASNLQGDGQNPTSVGGDASVSFNGNRTVHNLFMMDGGEDDDRGGGGTFSIMPSIEGLGEFRTLTSNYDAEYGLSSAATMTTVMKSGTSKLHGSAWEYFRNDALDATNFFQKSKTELRYNIFGANVGGPIDFWKKQHKSFFFYNQEWRRFVNGGSVNHDVPGTAWYPDATTPGFAVLPNAISVPTTVAPAILFGNCDGVPNGIDGYPVAQGSPFAGNGIPDCMIAGNATALLGAGIFPADNAVDSSDGLPQFKGGGNQPTNVREEMVRVDHTFNDKVSVFGHFVYDSVLQTFGTTMWSGDNMPTVGNTFGNPSDSAVAHVLHTIRPNLLNEVAFNYSGNKINILPKGVLLAPAGYAYNKVFPGTNPNIPTISLSGGTGANYDSNWTPWLNHYNDYQIRDDVSWTRGAHQIRMGGSWALYAKVQDVFASTQGHFTFNGSFSGDSFGDFLLGDAQDYQEDAIHDHGNWNAVSWAAYVQDDWRASKKLTLNLGVRWDGAPHTYEVNHRMSSFYASLYQPANAATFDSGGNICSSASDPGCTAASPGLGTSSNPNLAGVPLYLNGIGIGGIGAVPRGMVNNHWLTFGPRLGFAYDLTGQGKTVIRGGFGIMYERIQGNDMYDAATNVPADAHVEFNNVTFQNPNTLAASGNTAVAPIVATSITGFDPNHYYPPTSTQFSIGVEQALGAKAVLSVSYVGNQNRHQNFYQEINQPNESLVPCLVNPNLAGCGTVTPYNQVAQYPGFHSIRLSTDEANSHYNSLQASVRGHVARDLEIQAGWTFSKAVDPTTGGGNGFDLDNISNPYGGWRFDQGPSIFDRR